MCILELSKISKYEFHYDYIKNKYGNKSRLFTDIDSLMYEIETKNVYDGFSKNKEMFDFRNYSAGSKYYHDLNTIVVGKMKDQLGALLLKNLLD